MNDVHNREHIAAGSMGACEKAGRGIRHGVCAKAHPATELRKRLGIDIARVILGHKSPQVTEVYAALDLAVGIDVMAKVG